MHPTKVRIRRKYLGGNNSGGFDNQTPEGPLGEIPNPHTAHLKC